MLSLRSYPDINIGQEFVKTKFNISFLNFLIFESIIL